MKNWEIVNKFRVESLKFDLNDVIKELLKNRKLTSKKEITGFLQPQDPYTFTPNDVGIEVKAFKKALRRIIKAITAKESIVVYADYDADGITAGAVMWLTLHRLGASVMPYIPHRIEEGYGLSVKGIDNVRARYDPDLIITVDHGITAREKVAYAQKLGIEIIVTDHHVKPQKLPDCTIVHTTNLSGAGVSWFVAKEFLSRQSPVARLQAPGAPATGGQVSRQMKNELLALAAIGTIADMVPLMGPNRAIAKYGLEALNHTESVGLRALVKDAGLEVGTLKTYEVSHILAPRLNAMGRIVHALNALRLLCTRDTEKAQLLAQKLGLTNKERQQLMDETTEHARLLVESRTRNQEPGKLLFIAHEEFNQGVIGLVAGKLVETFYRPSIVVARGETVSKASARSINGFNIIEAIRNCMDILVDAGGHPMAAGFTVETAKLTLLQKRLEEIAEKELDEKKLTRVLKIDVEIQLDVISENLWKQIQSFAPFGMANPEPVFVTRNVQVIAARTVGAEGKHLKLIVQQPALRLADAHSGQATHNSQLTTFNAIGFGLGGFYKEIKPFQKVDIAYTIDFDTWNGNKRLQLKIKDLRV